MTRLPALWQRNVLGAVVVACVVGVYVAIDFGEPWSAYRHSQSPQVVVQKGDSGAAGGETWHLSSVKHFNRSPVNYGPALPAGTVLTVLQFDRSGTPGQGYCKAVITDGEKRWDAEGIGGFTPIPPTGFTSLCNQPGPIQFAFLLPDDVVPTAMDVTHDGQITVRMLL